MAGEERKPPQGTGGLLKRYGAGERDFKGVRLGGVDLMRANLSFADLIRANLSNANLRFANLNSTNLDGADLRSANLSNANLMRANLSNANLMRANLSSANLSSADLIRANLDGADLIRANLMRANLSSANLSGAYFCGANLSGASLRGADLIRASLSGVDLIRANLMRANLSFANLSGADLSDAHLNGASLSSASLSGVDLIRANLSNADLSFANLSAANLSFANLSGADLSGVHLNGTHLGGANLGGAILSNAAISNTNLSGVDLSPLCDASPPIRHGGPCTVDYRSIVLSLGSPNLKDFLQRTGMPEVFIEYMVDCARSLQTHVFKMLQSTFISYGGPDETFARKLYEALHRNGVTTFFFPEHAEPGKKLHRTMHEGVNGHDRTILVCSKSSLDRFGVLNELEKILEREARDGGASYLIPIRLDDYVFSGWKPPNADLADAVRARVVADFDGADKDDAKFNEGLRRLIRALRKPDPPKAAP